LTAPDQPPNAPREANSELVTLLEKKADSVRCYLGALRVLADDENPLRIDMAAHGLREMCDELEIAAGVYSNEPGLKGRVNELADAWSRAARGEDGALAAGQVKLTKRFDDFFTAFERDYPSQRHRAGATIQALAPGSRSWPPETKMAGATKLMGFRTKLNKGVHRSAELSMSELTDLLDALEAFLLSLFRPRTFAEFAEIDAIVKRGSLDE
jgi:hypothetical protein